LALLEDINSFLLELKDRLASPPGSSSEIFKLHAQLPLVQALEQAKSAEIRKSVADAIRSGY